MGIPENTVKDYLKRIFECTDCKNRTLLAIRYERDEAAYQGEQSYPPLGVSAPGTKFRNTESPAGPLSKMTEVVENLSIPNINQFQRCRERDWAVRRPLKPV
jgi:hypothetical protein